MGSVTGIQFQKNGKLYYFDTNGFDVKIGDYVIVDTARGYDLGEVVMATRSIDEENWQVPLKKLIRIATEQDIQHGRNNRAKEKDAFLICQKKIAEHKLEMKLVSVEYAFDNSKILFFFTANGRVDFRSLVKDLASVFKMRIELRQIGVRDEAKMLGGLGPCGRPICCGTFLEQFQPVSIKMAKEQNLSLNPTKISGVCGRLMCCLKYEQDHYEQARKRMPRVGREVETPDGCGPVTDLNIVKETVFVRLTNGDTSEIKEYPLESIVRSSEQPASAVQEPKSQSPAGVETSGERPTALKNVRKPEQTGQINAEPVAETESRKSSQDQDGAAGKHRNKSKGKRNSTLGQPVRRENPNRQQSYEPRVAASPEAPSAKKQESGQKKPSGSTSSPWADAVQKAMRAIDEQK